MIGTLTALPTPIAGTDSGPSPAGEGGAFAAELAEVEVVSKVEDGSTADSEEAGDANIADSESQPNVDQIGNEGPQADATADMTAAAIHLQRSAMVDAAPTEVLEILSDVFLGNGLEGTDTVATTEQLIDLVDVPGIASPVSLVGVMNEAPVLDMDVAAVDPKPEGVSGQVQVAEGFSAPVVAPAAVGVDESSVEPTGDVVEVLPDAMVEELQDLDNVNVEELFLPESEVPEDGSQVGGPSRSAGNPSLSQPHQTGSDPASATMPDLSASTQVAGTTVVGSSAPLDSTGTVETRSLVSPAALQRVEEALELLENSPPPRTLTIDLSEEHGVRIRLTSVADGVQVDVQDDGRGRRPGAWQQDLSQALANNGFDLAGGGQEHSEGQQDQGSLEPDTRTFVRRDTALRI